MAILHDRMAAGSIASLGSLYTQCFLVARAMDSPAHMDALRQAFIDAGVVTGPECAALEEMYVPKTLLTRHGGDGARKVPMTLCMFHHMLKGVRKLMHSMDDTLDGDIDRVFSESHLVVPHDKAALDASVRSWLPEVQTIVRQS